MKNLPILVLVTLLLLSQSCCYAQGPKVTDSVLYQLRSLKEPGDTIHYNGAIACMQKNRTEILLGSNEINKELDRLQTTLDGKKYGYLISNFFLYQVNLEIDSVREACIKFGKEYIARNENSNSIPMRYTCLAIMRGLRLPFRNSSHIYEGIEYFSKLNKKYLEKKDSDAVSITYFVIGTFYNRLGLIEEGKYYYLKSENYLDDRQPSTDYPLTTYPSLGIVAKYNRNLVLGIMLNNANRPAEAEFYLRKAVDYLQQLDSRVRIPDGPSLFINIARCKTLLNSDSSSFFYDEALHYLNLYRAGPLLFAHYYMNKADDCFRKNRLDLALYFINRSKSLKDSFNLGITSTLGELTLNYYIAAIKLRQNKAKDAIDLLNEEIAQLRAINSHSKELQELKLLAQAYTVSGMYKDAYNTLAEALSLNESIELEKDKGRLLNFEIEKKAEADKSKIVLLETENRVNRKLRYYFYGIMALLGLFAATLGLGVFNKQRSNRWLAAKNNELTLALDQLKKTQAQLIQSEKMASLGELTAGIAHEIQNPLNFVNNFSEVNRELIEELEGERSKVKGERNEEVESAIIKDLKENEEKINHHGKRADAIVKGMLQHSRTGSGTKEPSDINRLADEYLRLAYQGFRARDKSFNTTFSTEFDNSLGKVNIVPQEIGRAILNLINNAFYAVNERSKQAMPGYEPTVIVRTRRLQDRIEISVKDNGNGIPRSIKEKIFQPFFTTKPTGQGTGLGLSLAYDIVKAHGGEIAVETKEGEGSEFIVELPI